MAIKEVNFTKAFLEKLPTPEVSRDYYRDKEKGLYLYITKNGIKTFYIRKNINGKDDKIVLGNFPDLSIDNAIKKSTEARSLIVNGVNPKDKKKEFNAIPTLGQAFEGFIEKYAKIHKKSVKEDERIFNKFLQNLKKKKLTQVSKDDIQKLHIKVGEENGKVQANRLLQLISTVFNRMIIFGFNGKNPCLGIKKFKEQNRERFLQKDEIERFFTALNQLQSDDMKDCIMLSLLTGARKSNILGMKWKVIDLVSKKWVINEKESKNGNNMSIVLSDQAIEILKNRTEKNAGNSIWVFPSKNSSSGHLVEPKRSWKTLLKTSNIEDFHIHDLRRTMASYQAILGSNEVVIRKSLGQKPGSKATAIYARVDLDPVRKSVQDATDLMLSFNKKNKH